MLNKNYIDNDEFKNIRINKETFALIGNPVGHSLSDILHKKVFELKNEDKDYLLVESHCLDDTIKFLKEECKGFNVTVPFKSQVIPYLDFIDEIAKDIGAVNTILIKDNKLYGYNSDYYGFLRCLKEDKIKLKDATALIIGYGGVARMIAYALLKNSAKVSVYGRNKEKADEMINDFKNRLKLSIDYVDESTINSEYDLLINATPLGMYPKTDGTPIDISRFKRVGYVFDTVYNPRKTNFIKEAEKLRIPYSDGLKMLIYQGLKCENYWNNYVFSDKESEILLKTVETELFLRRLKDRNIIKIILIGFMGCGKSTVAKALNKIIKWKTLDTDSIFEEKYGLIKNIFKDKGENYFREKETEILSECIKQENVIISTGGGIVERQDNLNIINDDKNLSVFLNSPFNTICKRLKNTDRPLFQNLDDAKKLYEKRLTLYEKNSKIVINADNSISNIINEILKI